MVIFEVFLVEVSRVDLTFLSFYFVYNTSNCPLYSAKTGVAGPLVSGVMSALSNINRISPLWVIKGRIKLKLTPF